MSALTSQNIFVVESGTVDPERNFLQYCLITMQIFLLFSYHVRARRAPRNNFWHPLGEGAWLTPRNARPPRVTKPNLVILDQTVGA